DTSELDFGKCLNHLSKEFPCTNPVRDAEAVIEWMLAFKDLISELPQVTDILHALRQEKQRLFEAAQLENSEAEAAAGLNTLDVFLWGSSFILSGKKQLASILILRDVSKGDTLVFWREAPKKCH
ncbi:hypothetical protein FOZ63_009366, partial [Perkinsus olseni]